MKKLSNQQERARLVYLIRQILGACYDLQNIYDITPADLWARDSIDFKSVQEELKALRPKKNNG